MALDLAEIISDIPDLLTIIAAAEKAIKDLPAEATDLECGVAVTSAIVPLLGQLALKVQGQAKS
jgi:hypothetical protein